MWERGVETTAAHDRGLQMQKTVFHDECREFSAKPLRFGSLVRDDTAARLLDRDKDRIAIERVEGAQVEHFAVNLMLFRQESGRFHVLMVLGTPTYQCDVAAGTGHICFA